MYDSLAASKLVIHSPKGLTDMFPFTNGDGRREFGVIAASYANFGFVPYGHSMVSIVLLTVINLIT